MLNFKYLSLSPQSMKNAEKLFESVQQIESYKETLPLALQQTLLELKDFSVRASSGKIMIREP